ncbi:MAG TPA: GAF domain-containing SpoIIE family protein phosphatase [Longimicrobiales bacterium]
MPSIADRATLAQEIGRVADQYRRTFPDRKVRVWARDGGGWAPVYPLADGAAGDGDHAGPGPASGSLTTPAGLELAIEVDDQGPAREFFSRALEMILAYEAEARSAAREIAERYEEINLLYSISEVLGSVVSLPAAAQRILTEVAETLGGQRASLWIHDEDSDRLVLVASVGEGRIADSIAVDDPWSVTARVFREHAPMNVERGTVIERGDGRVATPSEEAFVSVPISYTPPDGDTRIIGVISLIGRAYHERFSAGDARLLAAVASQVGAALETQRLMEESVRRQRFQRELELAHDLQMKLLPSTDEFRRGPIRIDARCTPADTVGGDFYHLVRLSDTRCAVVIGDVSSHGFAAAMIMALTMSAIGIYARESDRPAEVLRHLHRSLVSELESTEMYMSIWYGVIDADACTITYANAGHPHAFVLRGDGTRERMDATNPPLGLLPLSEYGEGVVEWRPGQDLVVLFTDGLSDALGDGKAVGERELLDRVFALKDEPSDAILARVFADADGREVPPDDRTALVIRGG